MGLRFFFFCFVDLVVTVQAMHIEIILMCLAQVCRVHIMQLVVCLT